MNTTVNSNSTTNLFDEFRCTERTSYAEIDTVIKLDVGDKLYLEANPGQGVAVSGHLKANYYGGEAEFVLGANENIGGNLDLNLGSYAGVEVGASASAAFSLVTKIELPKMEIELSGAGCGVIMGSCKVYGTSAETIVTSTDNSTLDIIEVHEAGQSYYLEAQTSVYRSPFGLKSAKAEYIVIR